jgi:hypothetical protein
MRTTLNLDDDVIDALKDYADRRAVPLGKAVSELVKKAIYTPTPTKKVHGFVVFDVPPDEPRITPERVNELDSELE